MCIDYELSVLQLTHARCVLMTNRSRVYCPLAASVSAVFCSQLSFLVLNFVSDLETCKPLSLYIKLAAVTCWNVLVSILSLQVRLQMLLKEYICRVAFDFASHIVILVQYVLSPVSALTTERCVMLACNTSQHLIPYCA